MQSLKRSSKYFITAWAGVVQLMPGCFVVSIINKLASFVIERIWPIFIFTSRKEYYPIFTNAFSRNSETAHVSRTRQ